MIQTIVAVYDYVSEVYARPIFVANVNVAIRSLRDEVNNPQSEIGLHSKDYALFKIGTFDDNSGVIVSEPIPVLLVRADSLKETA